MVHVTKEDVLNGSRGIQAKRVDIVELVHTLVGALCKSVHFETEHRKRKVRGNLETIFLVDVAEHWTAFLHPRNNVTLAFRNTGPQDFEWTFSRRGDKDLPAEKVRMIYPHLQSLLDGIVSEFPQAIAPLQPLLDEATEATPSEIDC